MRPSRDQALMSTAFIWASRGTCSRLHVGCVISKDGRILVQGYNGAPTGLDHCSDAHQIGTGITVTHPTELCRAAHAEQNAISWAARVGVSLGGAQMHCTHQPCLSCARSIINAGIVKVSYVEPYRLKDGVELLQAARIEVIEMIDFPRPE